MSLRQKVPRQNRQKISVPCHCNHNDIFQSPNLLLLSDYVSSICSLLKIREKKYKEEGASHLLSYHQKYLQLESSSLPLPPPCIYSDTWTYKHISTKLFYYMPFNIIIIASLVISATCFTNIYIIYPSGILYLICVSIFYSNLLLNIQIVSNVCACVLSHFSHIQLFVTF